MARNFFTLTTSAPVALTAATPKTVLQLVAGAGTRLAVQVVTVSFDSTSNTAQPVIIQLRRQTTAGTATARAPLKKDTDIATALQANGQENFTVEPTDSDIVLHYHIHPQAGAQYPVPLPGEIIVPGGARIGLKINAPAGVNCLATIEGEE
jgi:hypothetical protein